jgi:hypothetical protein
MTANDTPMHLTAPQSRGPGRPSVSGQAGNTAPTSIVVPPRLREVAEALAAQQGMSLSEWVREAMLIQAFRQAAQHGLETELALAVSERHRAATRSARSRAGAGRAGAAATGMAGAADGAAS